MKTLKIVIVTLIILYSIAEISGAFKIYNNPSTANEPNLRMNSKMLVSNLFSPKPGDFICFDHKDDYFGKFIKVNRLCGLGKDTVQIIDGLLYLNGKNFDEDLNLVHNYIIEEIEFKLLESEGFMAEEINGVKIDSNSYIVSLDKRTATKYQLNSKRNIIPRGEGKGDIYKGFNQNWNKDNFGPVVIPKGKFFVLGDNRDNSMDSRSIGFKDLDDVVGMVIYPKK